MKNNSPHYNSRHKEKELELINYAVGERVRSEDSKPKQRTSLDLIISQKNVRPGTR